MNASRPGGRSLIAGQVALSGELRRGWIEVRDSWIAAVETGPPPREPDRSAPIGSRGLCDLQVNGGAGLNITDGMGALREIDALQLRHGVTSYLPTIITTSEQEATETVATITERMKDPGSPIAGIHLEGPFLSPGFEASIAWST